MNGVREYALWLAAIEDNEYLGEERVINYVLYIYIYI